MAKYKFEQEDIVHYFKVLSRSTTLLELETRRREIYRLIFLDHMTAIKSNDKDRIELYEKAEIDLIDAILEIRAKINQNNGEITYNPKHRKKSHART